MSERSQTRAALAFITIITLAIGFFAWWLARTLP